MHYHEPQADRWNAAVLDLRCAGHWLRPGLVHLGTDGGERGCCGLEVLAAVRGGYLYPDPRLSGRDHRITEADHVYALFQEQVGHPGGARGVADHHGHDRVVTGQDVKAEGGHPLAEPGGIVAQAVPQVIAALQQVQDLQRGTHHRGRYRIGEKVGPRALAKQVNDLLAAAGVAAAGPAQRLAQSSGYNVDAVADTVQFGRAAAVGPNEPHRVRVVDHDHRPVTVGQVTDLAEWRDVTVHGEHAVGGDEAASRVGASPELSFEVGHVAIAVAQPSGLAQPDPVDDGGMVQFVADDGVLLAEQRLEQPAVGVEAGGVQDGVLGTEKAGDALLKLLVHVLGTADEPDAR